MKSRRTARFRELYAQLPESVRRQAMEAYRLFEQDPWHPGLHFKRVSKTRASYLVRIGRGYRAVGIWQQETIVWFWIGSHADYDHLLSQSK